MIFYVSWVKGLELLFNTIAEQEIVAIFYTLSDIKLLKLRWLYRSSGLSDWRCVCEAAVFYNLYLLCSSVHIFSTVFHYQPTGFADDELQRWLLFHPGTKISISHYILYDWTVLNVTCNLTVEAYSTTGRRMFCFADNKKSTGNLDWWNCRVMQTP